MVYEEIYALTIAGNYVYNWAYDKQKNIKLSKLEQFSIGVSALAGIDSLVTPSLLGDSLHNILGLGLEHDYGQAIVNLEFLAAGTGALYFTARNAKLI